MKKMSGFTTEQTKAKRWILNQDFVFFKRTDYNHCWAQTSVKKNIKVMVDKLRDGVIVRVTVEW